MVPLHEFLFGLNWEPQIAIRADQIAAEGAFGWLPVILGTMVISAVALLIATPIGLLSAIYLNEFAPRRLRAVVKPLLEILAGVPTVVYGFFAILVVAPAIRSLGADLGIPVSPNTALAAGGVMGIMLIPFISSFADDALSAVPRSLRDGSLALGATRGETMLKVLFPAAIPGIVGGVLLAVSRAIGETMIVVMAAGLIARMTINPLDSVTTVTVQIVTLLIGDTAFDNPKTLAAFALGTDAVHHHAGHQRDRAAHRAQVPRNLRLRRRTMTDIPDTNGAAPIRSLTQSLAAGAPSQAEGPVASGLRPWRDPAGLHGAVHPRRFAGAARATRPSCRPMSRWTYSSTRKRSAESVCRAAASMMC